MNLHKEPIYPVEPWTITENTFSTETNYRNETTFSLSNGYIGTRGTFEEAYPFSVEEGLEGNFVNGFYESEDIRYGEWNYGFPEKSQSLLNLPNAKTVKIFLDEEPFDLRTGKTEFYQRTLHLDQGIVTRRVRWTSPNGKRAEFIFERFVSFVRKNVMAQRVKVIPLPDKKNQSYPQKIRFISCLCGDVENHTRKTNPLVDYGPFGKRILPKLIEQNDDFLFFQGTTKKSKLTVACACGHCPKKEYRIKEPESPDERSGSDALHSETRIEKQYTYRVEPGAELVLDKFILYTTSLDLETQRLRTFLLEEFHRCRKRGYEALRGEQISYVKEFWKYADVKIQGDEALQQGIRFNLFHIMQSAGRDGRTGQGAKGLSGEGYEGHYFWDTEMYILPFFIYTAPEIARKLLEYRYRTLDQARARAKVLGHPNGALYPWRTINGEEASTYFPLGTAQYHINADIAYAFSLYVNVTGDEAFLKNMAAEVLCETARVWADVGCFAEAKDGRYCICSVTGPDEYNAIVDNNFYTNLMARENIRDALNALNHLRTSDEAYYRAFVERLQLTEKETGHWEQIVERMYFPYDEKRKIYPLDDGFLMRKPWDDSRIPPEKRHLLYENYHPLFVYRQRMSKQADAILGMYLHSNLFTEEELKRNYDFYQEVTLHHSSLSTCIFGILACQIGYYSEACEYFSQSARMDLDDYHDNFYAGIHAANMAGTWQTIVNGFAGLRTNNGKLELKPYLPDGWKSYSFKLRYRSCVVSVEVSREGTAFCLLEGEHLALWCSGKELCLHEKERRIAR